MSRPSLLTIISMMVLVVAMVLLMSSLTAPFWHQIFYKDQKEEVSLWGTCTYKSDRTEPHCKRMTGWKIICACSSVLGMVWLLFAEGLTTFYGFFLPDKTTAKYIWITILITVVYILSGVASWGGMKNLHDFPEAHLVVVEFSWGFYVAVASVFVTTVAVILMVFEYIHCQPLNLRGPPPSLQGLVNTPEPFQENDSSDPVVG